MAVFRCKMCGGDLTVQKGTSVCTCEYCGTQQTIPTAADEEVQNLFDRANVLRMQAEFDKAAEVYEKILQTGNQEAEVYWGLILCKYGIEYVDAPGTGRKVPTCHRVSYDAVTADEDYKSVIKYADAKQRTIYESEAKKIDQIQKRILQLAQKEEPYDVFICYKEKDEDGKRTPDSVLANDIYYQLTQEGFKVFYAAVTMESKLGSDYEPYIFSALNTAKVMLVVGTKPEYFNAAWVKNEWSRFLKLMKKDRNRLLIPCYKDMNPYDLPEEFAHLQAQNMEKIGFITDLVRGIKKVIEKEDDHDEEQGNEVNPVEDREKEEEYQKYIAEMQAAKTTASFQTVKTHFESLDGYKDSAKLAEECEKSIERIKQDIQLRIQQNEIEAAKKKRKIIAILIAAVVMCAAVGILVIRATAPASKYNAAAALMAEGKYGEALEAFEAMKGYKDSEKQVEACKTAIAYEEAAALKEAGKYEEAIAAFEALGEYSDSAEQIEACRNLIAYEEAVALKEAGKYEEAIAAFEVLGEYSDSEEQIDLCRNEIMIIGDAYEAAAALKEAGLYEEAIAAFEALEGYRDSVEQIRSCEIAQAYADAEVLKDRGQMEEYVAALLEIKDTYFTSLEIIQSAEVGETVWYGDYKGNTEWIVLERQEEEEKVLLLSKYVVIDKPYNTKSEAVTWKTSTIREWLNGEYYNKAFSEEEKTRILSVRIENPDNEIYNTDGGRDTTDWIFLLSIEETEQYLETQEERTAYLNNFVRAEWWTRSPGWNSSYAAYVSKYGSMDDWGEKVGEKKIYVRPAMWLDISEPETDPAAAYEKAVSLKENGQYKKAMEAFMKLDGYSNSIEQIKECKSAEAYAQALALKENGQYEAAAAAFEELDDYNDSREQAELCKSEAAVLEEAYEAAVLLKESGDYEAAIAAFEALNGYSDGQEQIGAIVEQNRIFEPYIIKTAQIGDIVWYGNYNGNTEWIVLDRQEEEERVLLLSKYAVKQMPYSDNSSADNWEGSDIRAWLNQSYLNAAFYLAEQNRIVSETDENLVTADQVFLLSLEETEQYFKSDEERQAMLADGTAVWWWLRTRAEDSLSRFIGVRSNGSIRRNGYSCYYDSGAVRPAIWIDISDLESSPSEKYEAAVSLMESSRYGEAIKIFFMLDEYGYRDCEEELEICETAIKDEAYEAAAALQESGQYEEAIAAYKALAGYRDSTEQIIVCENMINESVYLMAAELQANGKYEEALVVYKTLNGYKDSADQISACETAIKDEAYAAAAALQESGQYEEAIAAYDALFGYKDSVDQIRSIMGEHPVKININTKMNIIQLSDVGDTVWYGDYNGNAEWIVLEKEEEKVLLLSKYAIEQRPYNTKYTYETWKSCTLRKWLNDEYLETAFTEEERARILMSEILNPDNEIYGTVGGNATKDQIFLLSLGEAEQYFKTDEERTAELIDGTSVWWWLRSPGVRSDLAANVYSGGSVNNGGNYVDRNFGAVRPAMWIDISNPES